MPELTNLITTGLLTALFSGFVAAIVSSLASRKTIYVNAVTAERAKWIEKLRANVATYPAEAHNLFYKAKTEDWGGELSEEYLRQLRELRSRNTELKLRLNPRGEIDRNIIRIVDNIFLAARKWTDTTELQTLERLLCTHAQWLLKAEWEKVKAEARWSVFAKHIEARYLAEYREWTRKSENQIPDVQLA
ncbi:hypothetical protein [Bradyrhizobium sp. SZCCHNRI2007]|uniref:hypothetical protein n=1 Tax=Bradyrhizobium sp. SZCCHNRI2007 TaxID=3057281 RepID=UPI0028E49A17|nr:hypothetical protein [Bradyrhizobium sp. SZCCHNRI2007]